METSEAGKKSGRLALPDCIRGITLISMILYHACWDAVYIVGADWPWYLSQASYIWQQSICWTFIFLSGFCVPFSKRLLKRGLTVFGAGALVMLVTNLLLPEDRVIFGVLTLIGSCMLMMIPIRKITETGGNAAALFAVSIVLFILCKDINAGEIGTGMLHRILPVIPKWTVTVPSGLYRNLFTAYLGFPPANFYSTDYFSILPWCFLYLSGYAFHLILRDAGMMDSPVFRTDIRPLSFLGRHSLMIYLLHQPVLYLYVLLYLYAAKAG